MQKVKLNIVPKGVKKTTYLSQNDNGRVVRYELFNELIPYILDGSETITLKVVRPDGEEIFASIENTFEGEAYIDVSFNDDMSAITGVGAGEIKIKDGETELGSHNFDINVEIDAYNGKDVVIETETGTLLSFNTEVEDNALEYESEIPYNAAGYTGLRVINSRTTPAYDKTPYLFRKTPSGSGNSCIEKLSGLSVAFNQLVKNGNFEDSNFWIGNQAFGDFLVSNNVAKYTITVKDGSQSIYQRSADTIKTVANHKYFLTFTAKMNENSNSVGFEMDGGYSKYDFSINANTLTQYSIIFNSQNNSTGGMYIYPKLTGGLNVDSVFELSKVMRIDLTQMFGSTIADYIYSLETAQAGAGVAYFKALFGADYYQYNAGELISVKTSGRKTIGFNQFDEETELGGINSSTGENMSSTVSLRSKNYIAVIPNTQYFNIIGSLTNAYNFQCRFYDANKNYIGYSPKGATNAKIRSIFTIPDNAYYMRFAIQEAYGTTYNHDICINISDPEKNGTYEPYSEETYNLGGDELRGLLKLDSNNNIYADGDIKTSDGNIKRKYGIVDLGSLTWSYSGDVDRFISEAISVKPSANDNTAPNILCAPYITVDFNYFVHNTPNKTITSPIANGKINIRDTSYGTDSDAFKTAMNGIYLIYEKETPTTESSTPFDNPQEVKVTEEFIDERSIPIPVGHDTIYGTDIEYQDIDFDTTIFGGDINAIDGVLTSRYNSDGSVKTTPEIIDITPTPIPVKAGDNKIFNSANGNQTIRYYNQVEE